MAGLDLCVGDAAIGLDLDEENDLAANVHAVSEFGVDGWDAGDDSAIVVASEGSARAENETYDTDKRTCRTNGDSQLKPPRYRGCIGYRAGGFNARPVRE